MEVEVQVFPPVVAGEESPDCISPAHELHLAAMMGDLSDVERFLGHVHVDEADARGWAAIHHAALGTSPEMLLLLLMRGASVTACTGTGATPLHLAAFNGRQVLCKLLVLHSADLHAEDEDGRTPLFDASASSSLEVLASWCSRPTSAGSERPATADPDTPDLDTLIEPRHCRVHERRRLPLCRRHA